MKLFQVNEANYIAVDSVVSITMEPKWAIVITDSGVKHRITLEQARVLLSCFEVIKPIVDVTDNTKLIQLSN